MYVHLYDLYDAMLIMHVYLLAYAFELNIEYVCNSVMLRASRLGDDNCFISSVYYFVVNVFIILFLNSLMSKIINVNTSSGI